MKYLKIYTEVIQSWKVHVSVAIVIFLSFLQGIIHTIGTLLNIFDYVNITVVIIDSLLILTVFVAYYMAITVVKKQKRDVEDCHVLDDLEEVVT